MLLAIALIFAFVFAVFLYCSKRDKLKYQQYAEHYINCIFIKQTYRPEVKADWSYGTPFFSVRFTTDKEKIHAKRVGLTDKFIEEIQKLCDDIKPRGEKFDASLAVSIFSIDDEMRWEKEADSILSSQDKDRNT